MKWISTTRLLLLTGLPAIVLPGACTKKEPDHVIQLRAEKKRRAEKKKQPIVLDYKKKDPNGHERTTPKPAEHFDDSKWPPAVRLAMLRVFRARFDTFPPLARKLAQLGPPAFPALRYLISHPRQSKGKHATLSLMLAKLHMFRPKVLGQLAKEPQLPFLQRAAIEQLARLKDDQSQELLLKVRESEKPIGSFIDKANRRQGWNYSWDQLHQLDEILFAKDAADLKKKLLALKDLSLEDALLEITRLAVARPLVQGMVAKRIAMLSKPEQLRVFAAGKKNPPLIRVAATQRLIDGKRPADLAFVKKLTKDVTDPISTAARQMLARRKKKKGE